ncbi:MAG TPA: GNAT family N-acetyltransferase [Panacibacter sp.]|nr:GNAT family N-acetyltransferase [Panacibacter sp.]HNP47004.1 GNAT family N-acetyltransferase [Panacibacter sp.]
MILRQAKFSDIGTIWEILQQAIEQRRLDGSEQWQQGYPNLNTVHEDIANDYGYVLTDNNVIIAYAAVIFGIEPAYNEIDGSWLTNQDYMAVHRVATSNSAKGKGVATKLFSLLEDLCIQRNVFSIKVDTNFDNAPMLRILEKLSYTYCGEIIFGGAPRKAFEKVLHKVSI